MSANIVSVLLVAVVWLTGCAGVRTLMPTPNLYASGQEKLYRELNPALQTRGVELLYATDRVPEKDEQGRLVYGYGRSNSIAFGSATVRIGDSGSWDAVYQDSLRRERRNALELSMGTIREIGRFPPTPFPYVVKGGLIEVEPETLQRVSDVEARWRGELNRRLALTPRKEVLVFVHGYNNGFDDAAYTLAEIWHFFGREGVPILYTWPAGRGGFKGYAYDRESGEFTVFHLKQLFRALSRYGEIEKVHVLAHSRGTDVTTTALRELLIESRSAGIDPRLRYKIASLVLAAPDMDLQVVQQRLQTEPIAPAVGQVTVYASKQDRAIGFSQFLFGGLVRIGNLTVEDLDPDELATLGQIDNVSIVDVQGEGGLFGHGYFHANPAASSDLLLMMRYGRKPGAEGGRPMESLETNFWRIDERYPSSK